MGRHVSDVSQCFPEVLGWIGVLHLGFAVVPEGNRREPSSKTSHALGMPLLGYPRAVFLDPARSSFPLIGGFVAVHAEDNRADNMEFGNENVDK